MQIPLLGLMNLTQHPTHVKLLQVYYVNQDISVLFLVLNLFIITVSFHGINLPLRLIQPIRLNSSTKCVVQILICSTYHATNLKKQSRNISLQHIQINLYLPLSSCKLAQLSSQVLPATLHGSAYFFFFALLWHPPRPRPPLYITPIFFFSRVVLIKINLPTVLTFCLLGLDFQNRFPVYFPPVQILPLVNLPCTFLLIIQFQFSSRVAIFRIEIQHACLMHVRNSCD